MQDEEGFDGYGDLSDEELLGESTLAKIRRAAAVDEEEEDVDGSYEYEGDEDE
jgi:hypothetical protein